MHTHGSSLGPHSFHICFMCHLVCLSDCSLFDDSTFLYFLTIFSLITLSFCPSTSSSRMWWTNSLCTSASEDLGTLAEYDPLTGYEPNDYHITEAYEHNTQESSDEQRSPNDFDYDDVTISKALSGACRRQAEHSQEEGLSSCLSSFVSHDRTVRPVVKPFDSQISSVQVIQRHSSESEQIRILLERQREQILADERLRQDHQLLHEQFLKQNWDLREAHEKSFSEMEELKRFQGSTFDTIARRKLVEYRDTILELTGKIQELQNEINCMNDSRDFQDAESVRSGHSHVTSQPVSFPPHPMPEGMLSRSLGMPSRKNGPPSIWAHMVCRETFLQIQRRLLQHHIRKS